MDELVLDNFYKGYRAKEKESIVTKHRIHLIKRMKALKENEDGVVEAIYTPMAMYDVFGDWKQKYYTNDYNEKVSTLCVCGHVITNIYKVRYGKKCALIGCECIKQFDPKVYAKLQSILITINKNCYCTICDKECKPEHFETQLHKNKFNERLKEIIKKKLTIYYEYIDNKRRIKDTIKKHCIEIIKRVAFEQNMISRNLVQCQTCPELITRDKYRPQCLNCWASDRNVKIQKKVYLTDESIRRASKKYYELHKKSKKT